MIQIILVSALSILSVPSIEASAFDQSFENATLRIDYNHVGNATEEIVTVDRLWRQGVWAGSRTTLIDETGLGGYLFKAVDEHGRTVFSRSFDSYFGEYRTTAAAASGTMRSYHESVLMPFPKKTLQGILEVLRRDGTSSIVATFEIDPKSTALSTEAPDPETVVIEHAVAGAPADALDLVIVGEGYTSDQLESFRQDLRHFGDLLLGFEPYASCGDMISIRGVFKASDEPGCDEPTHGAFRRTALSSTFNALGSSRYLLTEDNRALRDIAARVPYDAIIIMVNHSRYGGGGLYNTYCCFTAHNDWSEYLLLHELGHSLSGLADEYYTSNVAYNDFYPRGLEPREPNITALLDPAHVKWSDLLSPGIAVPTPWEKDAYDSADLIYQEQREKLDGAIAEAARNGADELREELEHKSEALSRKHAEGASAMLQASQLYSKVGVFEGAGYSATGLYRPSLDCLMFSKGAHPFCPVCQRAVLAAINRYVSTSPANGRAQK